MKVVTDLSKSFNPVPKTSPKISPKSDKTSDKKRKRATNKKEK